jgi:hypothetical protein
MFCLPEGGHPQRIGNLNLSFFFVSLQQAILLFGLILIQACAPVMETRSYITAPAKEGWENIKRAEQYNNEGNYDEAEAEATRGLIKCDEAKERYVERTKWRFIAEDKWWGRIYLCRAYGWYQRGFALIKQGDLSCAALNLEWTAEEAKKACRSDLEQEAFRLLIQVKEIKGTNWTGRRECPTSWRYYYPGRWFNER